MVLERRAGKTSDRHLMVDLLSRVYHYSQRDCVDSSCWLAYQQQG